MELENIRIRDIELVVEYANDSMGWTAYNRKNHIIGVQLYGAAVHTFEDKTFTIGESCIYYLNQSEGYKVDVISNCKAYSVHFTTYENITTPSFCIPVQSSEDIVNLIDRIKCEHSLSSKGDNLALSHLYRLCHIYSEHRRRSYAPSDLRMEKARDMIDLHFWEKDCIEKAAALSGITRRRFNELFRLLYRITPNRYVVSKRIDLAKQLLSNSYLPIADIALRCGFADQYYFNRTFKAETGITPGRYRKDNAV